MSTDTGIVALDFNYGHLDLDVDKYDNLVYSKTIYYDLSGSAHQNEFVVYFVDPCYTSILED